MGRWVELAEGSVLGFVVVTWRAEAGSHPIQLEMNRIEHDRELPEARFFMSGVIFGEKFYGRKSWTTAVKSDEEMKMGQ